MESPRPTAAEISLLLLGLALLLLASPLRLFWAHPARPWYTPFLVWLLLVVLGGLAARVVRADEP
jgi:hypothetical protein